MDDILRPELIWIEGRCYRMNDIDKEMKSFQEHDLYEEEVDYEDDEEDEEDFEITKIDDSRYSTQLHVPKHYLGSIIGKKGATKSRIEHDTRTTVKIPKQGQSGDVVILGPSIGNVKAARKRINIIVMSSRMKQRPTHFLSIPLNMPVIIENFNKFKEAVLTECADRGVEESIFTPATKLHLTMGVMCLMDEGERQAASTLLAAAATEIVVPCLEAYKPLRVKVKGLSYMNDNPKEIDVLYGLVQEANAPPGTLQNMVDALHRYFDKNGFLKRDHERDNVKLHVTLLNSRYRSQSSEDMESVSKSYSNKPRESFDGSRILERFADWDFGVATVEAIHLSQRHTWGPDGYYQPTCVASCYKGISL